MNTNSKIISKSKKRRERRKKIKNKIKNIEEIKRKIESDAEKKVVQLNKNTNSFQYYEKNEFQSLLIDIIQTGADEFKEKIGRNMTYSEMREMFG